MSISRHFRAFGDAWSAENRRQRAGTRTWNDTDFLPAALEVTESPPSPIGRTIIWLISVAAISSFIWACVSKVDTVAIAEGRLVPEGRLRSVEAAQQGVIRAIHVREGQHVTAGEVLVELDPTIANAEAATARNEYSTASLTRARDNALLAYLQGKSPVIIPPVDAAPEAIEAERILVASRIEEYQAKLQSIAQRRAGAQATARASEAEISKVRETLPLLKEALDLQVGLERQGFGARQRLLQQQQAYVSAQADLNAQTAQLDEARAQVAALSGEAAQARGEFVTKAAQERAEAEGVVVTRGNTVRAADQRQGLQVLKAPVSGIVQELSVTNIGEVSEVGKPLITIVPDGEPLVVEALLLNSDVGFVRAGMPAAVKIEAFPFTKYGTLSSRVDRVSPDATLDQKRGLVFPVRLPVSAASIMVDGHPAVLSAGMTVSAEIVTGSRTVLDLLFSPIAKAAKEAGRER